MVFSVNGNQTNLGMPSAIFNDLTKICSLNYILVGKKKHWEEWPFNHQAPAVCIKWLVKGMALLVFK